MEVFKVQVKKERIQEMKDLVKEQPIVSAAFGSYKRAFYYYDKWIVFASEDSKRVATAACTPKDDSHLLEQSIYLEELKEKEEPIDI